MNQHLLSALKKELENSFGRKVVSSRDCLQLVEDIYQKTGYTINANTLRRFFGLVKTDYSASPSTVTILSKYCGFGSIDEIESLSVTDNTEHSINREAVMNYLVSLFKNLDKEEGYNNVAGSMVQQTIVFLERNPFLIDRFQRELAKIPGGQYYYYELSVNMDHLNDYYGNALRYYERANNSNEAKLFANSLQVFRYWLTENTGLLEKHMAEIAAIPVHHNYPSHILGRLVAARIYSAHTRNEPMDKILIDATKYHVAIMSKRGSSTAYPDFELAICEALTLVNQYDEAMEYIRRGKSMITGSRSGPSHHPFRFWEYVISGKKNYHITPLDMTRKQAGPPFHSSNYPLNKKYDNLVLLLNNPGRKTSQVAGLIQETGFTRFQHLYTRKVENL